jgi:hypothetical protein
VDFPFDLDLSEYVLDGDSEEKPEYELFAVSHHHGSVGGGHYTATVTDQDGRWWLADDASTSELGGKESARRRVVSPSAYILFYRRKTGKPDLRPLKEPLMEFDDVERFLKQVERSGGGSGMMSGGTGGGIMGYRCV